MADVLIVCVREDELQAKALADMFERAGFSVGGAPASDGALRSVGAGVVVWSQASIRSRPFLDAAQRVIDADKAVIASLIDPPPGHTINNAQAFALEGWTGDPEDAALDPLFFAVDRMVTSQRAAVGASPARPAPGEFEEPPSLRPPPAYNRPRSEPRAPSRSRNPEPPPARQENLGAEAEHWRAIRDSKDPADFMDYLARYGPAGSFSEVAEIKLKQLTGPKAQTPPPTGNLRDAAKSAQPQQRSRRLEPPAPPPVRMEPPRRIDPPPPPPRMMEAPPRRPDPPPPRREVREQPLPAAAYRRDYDAPPPHVRDNSARNGGMVRLLILALLIGGGAFGANYFLNNNGAPSEQVADETSEPPPSDVASNEPLPEGDGVGGVDISDEPVQLEAAPTPERAAPVRASPMRQQQQQQQARPQQQQRPVQQAAAEIEDGPPPAPRTSWSNEPTTTTAGGPASLLPGAQQPQPAPQVFAANNPPPAPPVSRPATPPGQVVFAQRPSSRRIADLYPTRAQRDGVGGRVQLDCVVRGDLNLSCAVGSETPSGMGFGQAALAASGGYRAQSSLSNGQVAAGSRARIVIVFQPPAE